MVDFPTNTTTNTTTTTDFTAALNSVLAASDGSIDEMHAINQAILTGEGIDQIIEAFAEENPTFSEALKNNKTRLKKPDIAPSQLMALDIEIPQEVAEKLGLSYTQLNNNKVTVNMGSFRQAVLKEALQDNENTFGLGNLNSETIDLLCLLLCQGSKSQIISTLKETLLTKVTAKQELHNEYLSATKDMVQEEIKAIKTAEEAKKTAIIKAAVNIALAVVTTAVSIGITIATAGAGGFLIAGAVLSVVSAIATCSASACTITAVCSEDKDLQEKLNNAALGLGIAAAVIGIVSCLCNLTGGARAAAKATEKVAGAAVKEGTKATTKKITKEGTKELAEEGAQELDKLEKFRKSFQILGNISNIFASLGQGATEIYSGVLNIKSAKINRALDDIKIEMAKLDQEIETLKSFIDALTQYIQKFTEDYLKNEQEVAETLQAKGDIELQLSQKLS